LNITFKEHKQSINRQQTGFMDLIPAQSERTDTRFTQEINYPLS